MLETPGLALQTTLSEVSRMGHIVEDTLEKSRNVMFTKDFQDIMEIKEMEVEKRPALWESRNTLFRSVPCPSARKSMKK